MPENVTFISINVQGLLGKLKKKDFFSYLRAKRFNIYFLQDTHFIDKKMKIIRSQWGFECNCSNFKSQSRGVAIMINKNFDFEVTSEESDTDDNLLILNCKIYSKTFSLFCIYGSNRDNPDFYCQIQRIFNNIDHYCILGGDYNLVLNPLIDYFYYKSINNPKAREAVLQMVLENDLVDCWRNKTLNLTDKYGSKITLSKKPVLICF
jgi:exonuclease III